MKSMILFLFFIAFAAVLGTGEVRNAFAKKSKDPKVLQVSILDRAEADRLFREFASDKEIPFKFPPDGCYARATEMVHDAEKENIFMGRVYVEGRLQVKTKLPQYPEVRWGWHVAPATYVRQADGTDRMMVFDPSLFERPVLVDEWTKKMETTLDGVPGRIDEVYYGSRFQYFTDDDERNYTEWRSTVLKKAKKTLKEYKEYEDLSAPYSTDDPDTKRTLAPRSPQKGTK